MVGTLGSEQELLRTSRAQVSSTHTQPAPSSCQMIYTHHDPNKVEYSPTIHENLAPGPVPCTHGHASYPRCGLILPSDHMRRCTCARSGIACGESEDVGAYARLDHMFTPTAKYEQRHMAARIPDPNIPRTMMFSLPTSLPLVASFPVRLAPPFCASFVSLFFLNIASIPRRKCRKSSTVESHRPTWQKKWLHVAFSSTVLFSVSIKRTNYDCNAAWGCIIFYSTLNSVFSS